MESGPQTITELNTQALVTLSPPLWLEAERIASEQNWTVNEAIVFLVKVGAESQRRAEANLRLRYQEFLDETDPAKQSRAGDEMIRAIFGPESVAQG